MSKGSTQVPLERVAKIDYGTRVTRKKDVGSTYPVYGGGGATFLVDDWNREDCLVVSRFAMSEVCVRYVPGRFFLNDSGLTVSTRDEKVLSQRFLDAVLISQSQSIYGLGRGTAQRNLNVKAFREFPIHLPSLGTQSRVVEQVDKIQDQVAQATSHINHQVEEARSLRAALLDERIVGREPDPGPGMAERTIGIDWPTVPLGQLAASLFDGDWIEKKDQANSGIRLIQTGNIGQGFFKPNDERARYVSPETFDRLKCSEVQPGDVLISRLPEPIGRACSVPELDSKLITAVDCAVLRLADRVLPEFFILYSMTSRYLQEVKQQASGTTRQRISRVRLSQIQIPVPPLTDQKRIVTEFEGFDIELAELESKLAAQKAELAAFQSAALSEALAGGS